MQHPAAQRGKSAAEVQVAAGELVRLLLQWSRCEMAVAGAVEVVTRIQILVCKGSPADHPLPAVTPPSARAKEGPPNSERSCGPTAGSPLYPFKLAERSVSRQT